MSKSKSSMKEDNNTGTEEELQQKYMQFQLLQQQLEQVNQHMEQLTQQAAEIERSIQAIKEISKTEVDNEILAPITNGIFIKAKLLDNEKLIVNVGADITVEKTISEVIKLLEEQKKQLHQQMMEADAFLREMSAEAQIIYQEIEKT